MAESPDAGDPAGAPPAGEIAARFDLAKPTLSGHFAVLREAELIQSEKSGTTTAAPPAITARTAGASGRGRWS